MGVFIIIMGIIYNLTETAYFGWHLFPNSADEVLADGISTIIIAMGFAVIRFSRRRD
jgi:hypothetical protein